MQVRLEVSHKSGKKKTVNIHSDAVIGRSTECSLRIASSEISRKHCKLTVIESGVLVRDLESANGTWIDGVMIPPNRDVALPPGSRLSIGPVQFLVHYESSNPNIEQPGSTVEMPVMRALPDSDEIPPAAEGVPEILPADDPQPPDNVADAVATVVVDPAAVQQALAESFADGEPESEAAIEVEPADSSEVETTEVTAMVDDATSEVTEPNDAEPNGKGKLGSMFGGLLKFGRKSKDKPANDEPPATDANTADDAPAAPEADSEPAVDKEQLDVGAVAETGTEYAADTEEGEYTDDEEYEDEYEDEEEVDAELGDFFNQFEE